MPRACVRRGDIPITALGECGAVVQFIDFCNRNTGLRSVRQRTLSMGRTVAGDRLPSERGYLLFVCQVARGKGLYVLYRT
jgi:hypothetical protein